MNKSFIIFFIYTFISCGNTTENFKIETFNNIEIKVPSSLMVESSSLCENKVSFKDANDSIFIHIKLCD